MIGRQAFPIGKGTLQGRTGKLLGANFDVNCPQTNRLKCSKDLTGNHWIILLTSNFARDHLFFSCLDMKSKLKHADISKCMWDQTAFVWLNVSYLTRSLQNLEIGFKGPESRATKDNENLRRMDQYIPVINRRNLPYQLVQDFFHQPYLKINMFDDLSLKRTASCHKHQHCKNKNGKCNFLDVLFAMYIYLFIVNLRFETNIHHSILSMNGIFAIRIGYIHYAWTNFIHLP